MTLRVENRGDPQRWCVVDETLDLAVLICIKSRKAAVEWMGRVDALNVDIPAMKRLRDERVAEWTKRLRTDSLRMAGEWYNALDPIDGWNQIRDMQMEITK